MQPLQAGFRCVLNIGCGSLQLGWQLLKNLKTSQLLLLILKRCSPTFSLTTFFFTLVYPIIPNYVLFVALQLM